ncbi:MAG: CPBP family intramembrane metalloprotease [Crocinitomicaceae bacterium]|nr:CPBP family intramembrane metalloprotease [Crocinitomicaceae bacterium]
MGFNLPYSKQTNNALSYGLTLLIILIAYIIGSMPSAILYAISSLQTGDVVQTLQNDIGSIATFIVLLFPWVAVFFSIWFSAIYVLKWPFSFMITNRPKIDYRRFLFGFTVWFAISLITFLTTLNELITLNFQLSKFIVLVVVASIVLLLQCTAEELVFRSFLMKWLGSKLSIGIIQVVITGALFGYLHGSNPEVAAIGNKVLIYYISTGIFLGLIAVIDEGIELTSGFHFANNLFAALMVTKDWQVFQTDAIFVDRNPPSFTLNDFLISLLGQVVFFIICWRFYKWESIKSKLF